MLWTLAQHSWNGESLKTGAPFRRHMVPATRSAEGALSTRIKSLHRCKSQSPQTWC